jgi:hypothetical protein
LGFEIATEKNRKVGRPDRIQVVHQSVFSSSY